MMETWKKYIVIIIISVVTVLLLRSVVWSQILQSKLNKNLSPSGWQVNVERSSGYILGTTYLRNLKVSHKSGSTIIIDKLSVNFGILSSIIGSPVFDLFSIEGVDADLSNYYLDSPLLNEREFVLNIPYHIRSFFVDGRIKLKIKENDYSANIIVGGELIGMETPSLKCDIVKISLIDNSDINCNFYNLLMSYDGSNYQLEDLSGEVIGLPIRGSIKFNKDQNNLTGTIDVKSFTIPEELFKKLPLKTKFSTFAGNFNFKSDLKSFNGQLILENELGLDMNGHFSIIKEKTAWVLKNLELSGENSRLTLNGLLDNGNRISSYMNLENLDLGRWVKDQKETNMSGLIILDAGLSKLGALDQIEMSLEMIESKLFDQGEISIHGQISYQDSIISTIDPVMLMVDESYLTLNGMADFKSNTVDLVMVLERADIELVNSFLPGEFVSGKATGALRIRGKQDSPSANAELLCENVKISDFHLESLKLNSQLLVESDTLVSGYIDIIADQGTWRNKSFESGTVSAVLKNKEVVVENCHFKSGDDFLQVSGSYDGTNNYSVDRFQLAYQDNYMVNARPILFFFKDSILSVELFELHIDDGMLEGEISGGNNPEGHFKMSNFDAQIITQFFNDQRLRFSGLIFGEMWVQYDSIGINLDTDISLKNGKYMGEVFDEMILSCLFKNGILHLDDLSMTKKGTMGLQANGIIPLRTKEALKTSISLESNFSNISLEFIHRFIPKFFTLGGDATGGISLKGVKNRTEFTYDLEIENSQFDKIALGKIISQGRYDGERLFVDSVKSIGDHGKITANGSIPFDLNIGSSSFGDYFRDDSLDFYAFGQLSSLSILTPYFSDLDSVNGEFDLFLSLSGSTENIQRNGHLKVNDGKVYTLLISDPITEIEGTAIMKNNELSINDLVGTLYSPSIYQQKIAKRNMSILGTMDFSKFFNPGYDLNIKANEASYRLLALDVSGLSNLDISVVGKDTVTISGTVETLDAKVFYEFTTEDVGTALDEQDKTVMVYNINIPIKGNAFFQNSQIDAEITGELSLSQMGHQEMDFGGQIFVEDGSVFSYKDNFKELQGIVSFDNKGFNPLIDVNAYTMIDDERINLRIAGGIEDLDIILESGSGFSESDILELLTWGKRFEDQELSSTGFGNQTVSVLGALLENQLEKNIKESSIGMMNYIDDIKISGAAGLLQGTDEDFELTAKRQIGDKTYLNLSYKKSFSFNQSQIGVEYKLNRNFSVVGNIDEEGNLNLKYRYRYSY